MKSGYFRPFGLVLSHSMAQRTGCVSSNFSLSESAGTSVNTSSLSSDFKSTNTNLNAGDGGPTSPFVRQVRVGGFIYTRTTLYSPCLPRRRTSSPTIGSKFKSPIANPPPVESILPPNQIWTATKDRSPRTSRSVRCNRRNFVSFPAPNRRRTSAGPSRRR